MEPKRILLAENEPETARFIESELQNLGLIVDTVADGDAAWNFLQAAKYALLICDENQQGIGFLTLAKMLRCELRFANLPIIFIVGKIEETDIPGPPFPYVDITKERHDLTDIGMWVQRVLRAAEEVESDRV